MKLVFLIDFTLLISSSPAESASRTWGHRTPGTFPEIMIMVRYWASAWNIKHHSRLTAALQWGQERESWSTKEVELRLGAVLKKRLLNTTCWSFRGVCFLTCTWSSETDELHESVSVQQVRRSELPDKHRGHEGHEGGGDEPDHDHGDNVSDSETNLLLMVSGWSLSWLDLHTWQIYECY